MQDGCGKSWNGAGATCAQQGGICRLATERCGMQQAHLSPHVRRVLPFGGWWHLAAFQPASSAVSDLVLLLETQ